MFRLELGTVDSIDPAAIISLEIEKLKRARASGDAPAFGRIAHTMKSVARAFGADRLSDAAQQLEALGFDDNLAAAGPFIEQLEAEHPRLRDYVGRLASA